jgi:EAL and modified HD-GYP domain-containing signal transduction protein
MSASVIFNSAHKTLPVSDLFVTRQPVLDRNQELVAYELLIRNASDDPKRAISDLSETVLVLDHFAELGLDKVVGRAHAFIKVDAAVLMKDTVETLPHEKITLEIIGGTKASPETLARIDALSKIGFRFSLNHISSDIESTKKLLPYVETVRFEVGQMDESALNKTLAQFDLTGKKLLAEKVETIAQFKMCHDLGFNFFQGYFYSKPQVVAGKKFSPSQAAIMQLMALISSDADSVAIEVGLKRDVALGLNILRLVNTPSIGSHRIDSLKQALMVLGRNQLQRWLQIMLYAEPGKNGQHLKPLLMLATYRGKLMELMAYKHKAGNASVADTAFMVGIMSLMDTLFGLPMEDVLKETPVIEEASDALLHRKGYFGDLLKFIEHEEQVEDARPILDYIKKLQMTSEEFYVMQLAAFEWSDSISHAV